MQFAFIYFFNLHFGQSMVILPKVVSKSGLLLSPLLMFIIVSVNIITSAHVLEAMGIANACSRLESIRRKTGVLNIQDVSIHYSHTLIVYSCNLIMLIVETTFVKLLYSL